MMVSQTIRTLNLEHDDSPLAGCYPVLAALGVARLDEKAPPCRYQGGAFQIVTSDSWGFCNRNAVS